MTDPYPPPTDPVVRKGDAVTYVPKSAWRSTRIGGLVLTLLAVLAKRYLPDYLRQESVDAAAEVLDYALPWLAGVGALVAAYGSTHATRPLTWTGKREVTKVVKCLLPLLILPALAGCAFVHPDPKQPPLDRVYQMEKEFNTALNAVTFLHSKGWLSDDALLEILDEVRPSARAAFASLKADVAAGKALEQSAYYNAAISALDRLTAVQQTGETNERLQSKQRNPTTRPGRDTGRPADPTVLRGRTVGRRDDDAGAAGRGRRADPAERLAA